MSASGVAEPGRLRYSPLVVDCAASGTDGHDTRAVGIQRQAAGRTDPGEPERRTDADTRSSCITPRGLDSEAGRFNRSGRGVVQPIMRRTSRAMSSSPASRAAVDSMMASHSGSGSRLPRLDRVVARLSIPSSRSSSRRSTSPSV